jgi:putative transposase
MLKAFKYELFPTEPQKNAFNQHFGCTRFIYNWGLEQRIKSHAKGTKLTCLDLANKLPELKKEHPWLSDVNSQTLQMPLRNLDNAFSRFFKKTGDFPKFKVKYRSIPKFQTPQHTKIDFKNQLVSLTKIPNIKFALDRTFEGTIKTVTVKLTPTKRYFISILVDDGKELPVKPKINPQQTIGLDLGLKDFCIDSNGNKVPTPKFFRKSEQKLKHHQRMLSKKHKPKKKAGSKHYQNQRLIVAKINERRANQRKDFLHKLSNKLIRENQSICLEDLAVGNMLKNHKLAKSIADAAWNEFRRQLEYKADWNGKNILTIGRFDPSSKVCNECGVINQNLTLDQREWVCDCGAKHDRDVNAAKNIKQLGLLRLHLGEPGQSINKASQRNVGSKLRPAKRRNLPVFSG